MRSPVFFSSVAACLFVPALVQAHGIPIDISYHTGQLHTDAQVYTSSMTLSGGGTILQASLPGFGVSLTSNGVPTNLPIGIDVVDKLWYWDGSQLTTPTASMLIENASLDSVAVTGSTGFQPGVIVGTYNGSVGWHDHLFYVLEPLPVDFGAYGVLLSVTAQGVDSSDPFLLVFNHGLSSGDFATGVAAMTDAVFAVPEPSTFALLGIGGLAVVVSSWRRHRR